jgi:hypothetical protein
LVPLEPALVYTQTINSDPAPVHTKRVISRSSTSFFSRSFRTCPVHTYTIVSIPYPIQTRIIISNPAPVHTQTIVVHPAPEDTQPSFQILPRFTQKQQFPDPAPPFFFVKPILWCESVQDLK